MVWVFVGQHGSEMLFDRYDINNDYDDDDDDHNDYDNKHDDQYDYDNYND
jgi:hypothetical protein